MNRDNSLPFSLEAALWASISAERRFPLPSRNFPVALPPFERGFAAAPLVNMGAVTRKEPPKALPKAAPPAFCTANPSKEDVLFGRGRPCMDHPGNVKLRRLASENKKLYQEFDCRSAGVVRRKLQHGVGSKQEIVDTIIQSIEGRFLKRHPLDESYWIEVPPEEARDKVSHILRCKRKRRNKHDAAASGDDEAEEESNQTVSRASKRQKKAGKPSPKKKKAPPSPPKMRPPEAAIHVEPLLPPSHAIETIPLAHQTRARLPETIPLYFTGIDYEPSNVQSLYSTLFPSWPGNGMR